MDRMYKFFVTAWRKFDEMFGKMPQVLIICDFLKIEVARRIRNLIEIVDLYKRFQRSVWSLRSASTTAGSDSPPNGTDRSKFEIGK